MRPLIIIGSGIASYSLIKEIRKSDPKKPIIVITQDKGDYYYKPVLSNAFGQSKSINELVLTSAHDIANKYSFELHHTCTVTAINTGSNYILTTQGVFQYNKLVLACGASPRKLPFASTGFPYIFSINSLEDYEKFRAEITGKKKITIIGSGFVGCEFANDLVQAGFSVTVISMDAYPLQAFISKDIGTVLKERLASLGIKWHLNTHVSSIDAKETEAYLTLNEGSVVSSEVILSAIGLEPNKELAKKSGIKVNQGIIADAYLKTNYNNIYTLGDCAEINGKVQPFIAPIRHAVSALSKTLLGYPTKVAFSDLTLTVKTPAYPITLDLSTLDKKIIDRSPIQPKHPMLNTL